MLCRKSPVTVSEVGQVADLPLGQALYPRVLASFPARRVETPSR